ncbi:MULTISPECIES: rhombosortase [unclassified Pseudoalteromonas]|uniref:rhombosortase n=1 Tax=unclassified Pseudoalteromonas TaxID=194690 RepID=UPI00051A60B5|nr:MULTISPECIES: rhombosortase [unclassified Pseudoalteromonas]KGK01435.1 Rhomboid-like serine protease, proteobacteria [Pseudoalteromonas sp. ND6B]TMP51347.1 rhombosortase [Pseudoalteromonas sp. S1688]
MLNLPLQPRYVLPPLCLIVLSTLLAWLGMNNELEFNRPLIEQGQLWRLFTSQFVHANWVHLGLNCAGIALIWLLHGEYTTPKQYSFNIALLALWCGLGVYWFCPTITIYTGLSALLHGVIVWGAIKDVTVGLKSGYILFIGVWIKLILEQVNGPSAEIGQLIQSTVAVDAHLIGAIGGVLLAVPLVVKHIKNDNKHS